MQQKRVSVFIDGSNFYFKLRELAIPHITYFDYCGFAKWLAVGREVVSIQYYIGVVRAKESDEKGQKLRKNQQRLSAHLASPEQNVTVRHGYLMRNGGTYHEKGVDVQIAVDLLIGAYENTYDVAIVLSSDTDLIPAIEKTIQLGKEVEYIGFAHKPSFGLQKHVTLSRLVIKDELRSFVRENKIEE